MIGISVGSTGIDDLYVSVEYIDSIKGLGCAGIYDGIDMKQSDLSP